MRQVKQQERPGREKPREGGERGQPLPPGVMALTALLSWTAFAGALLWLILTLLGWLLG
jgi:hypothetical protein